MKKCKFCDHQGFTEKGEEVCTKYLLYIGEDKVEQSCKGFEFTLNDKPIGIASIIITIGLILLMIAL